MQQRGFVIETAAGRARVRTRLAEACGDCGARGACACLGGGRDAVMWVDDPLSTRVGERVTILIPEAAATRATVLAYLLPAGALILGAVVGDRLAPRFGVPSDLGAAATGISLMGLSFFAARAIGKNLFRGPRILRKD